MSEEYAERTENFLDYISEGGTFSGDSFISRYQLDLRVGYRRGRRREKNYTLSVVDGPGGSVHTTRVGSQSDDAQEMQGHMSRARSLIICWPCKETFDTKVNQEFAQTLDAQLQIAYKQFQQKPHIIFALTKYDQLFQEDGVDAYHMATDPEVAKQKIGDILPSAKIQDRLHSAQQNGCSVFVAPCSAYGFIAHNGATNINRANPDSGMLASNRKDYGPGWDQFWRPMGVADVLLMSALGEKQPPKGGLIFKWSQFA